MSGADRGSLLRPLDVSSFNTDERFISGERYREEHAEPGEKHRILKGCHRYSYPVANKVVYYIFKDREKTERMYEETTVFDTVFTAKKKSVVIVYYKSNKSVVKYIFTGYVYEPGPAGRILEFNCDEEKF